MVDPSPQAIKESVERGASFVEWLVDVLRGKSWVRKLLLLDIVILAAFNPVSFPRVLTFFTVRPLPEQYPLFFWLIVGFVFVTAVVAAVRTPPKPAPPTHSLDRRSPIRGLLPFTFGDAELFSRLQREDSLRECLQAVTDSDFYFGILCGDSGCGKTSFLQAGLWPRLLKQNHRCVYVKFSDLDPLESIRASLTEQLEASGVKAQGVDLFTLLRAAAGDDAKPLIILFDQFEQFFVHHRLKRERTPFVQELTAWYHGRHQSRVKILACLRGDFYDHMIELQKAMGYSLGPQQSHRLRRFEPAEAAEILRVIAEIEEMAFDEGFVRELTEKELASREDGLITAVDIQILAWMISSSKVKEEQAFNRSAYQKCGGIEGLLEVFLTRVLEARETEARRQAAIKVLLALTDLERNVCAGVLTLTALKEKLGGTLSGAEIEEAVVWLGRGDVRLITPVKRKDSEGHELAHERLIPALRKIEGKSLSEADRANQLFDRRVNEWLGNNRASQYLLTWRETRLIERQRPHLIWGPQRAHKSSLLKRSRRRWRIRAAAVALPLAAAAGFLTWSNSESGKLYWIKQDVLRYSERGDKDFGREQVIIGLTYVGRSQQALRLAERTKPDIIRRKTFGVFAEALAKIGDTQQALQITERAETYDPLYYSLKVRILVISVLTAAKTGDTGRAGASLEQALEAADKIEDEELDLKVEALARIAVAAARAGDARRASELLGRAVKLVELVDPSVFRAFRGGLDAKTDALGVTVLAAVQVGDLQQALRLVEQVNPAYKGLIVAGIATTVAKGGDSRRALQIAEGIVKPEHKALALSVLADFAAEAGHIERAEPLMEQALRLSEQVEEPGSKAEALSDTAAAAAAAGDTSQVLQMAGMFKDPSYEAGAMTVLAVAAAKAGDTRRASELLERAIQVAERTTMYSDSGYKSMVLGRIAIAATRAGNLKIAHRAALQCDSDEGKAYALSLILTEWAKQQGLVTASDYDA